MTPDRDHKFDLALTLNRVEEAFAIAEETQNADKWKKVGDIALMQGQFGLAEKCFKQSQDFNSQLLFYTSCGDLENLKRLAHAAETSGKYNVAFQAAYLTGDVDQCLKILVSAKRPAEAAFFARAYCPSKLDGISDSWEEALRSRKLPFTPERIAHQDIIKQAVGIEHQIREMLSERASASDYERALVDYFRDLAL